MWCKESVKISFLHFHMLKIARHCILFKYVYPSLYTWALGSVCCDFYEHMVFASPIVEFNNFDSDFNISFFKVDECGVGCPYCDISLSKKTSR